MGRKSSPDFSIFFEWRRPADLRDLCFGVIAALEDDAEKYGEFANVINSDLQPLLDAQTAATFGIIYGQFNTGVLVRLCHPPQTDFQVRIGTQAAMWFEWGFVPPAP